MNLFSLIVDLIALKSELATLGMFYFTILLTAVLLAEIGLGSRNNPYSTLTELCEGMPLSTLGLAFGTASLFDNYSCYIPFI